LSEYLSGNIEENEEVDEDEEGGEGSDQAIEYDQEEGGE